MSEKKLKSGRAYARDVFGWPLYVFIWLLANAIPQKLIYFLASIAGDLLYVFDKKDRRIIEYNLSNGPRISSKLLPSYTRKIFRDFCLNLVEFFRFNKFNQKWFEKNVEVEGLENLKKAHSLGRGVVAISLHMGNWEMNAYITLLCGVATNGIWASHRNPKVDKFFLGLRLKKGIKVILTGGAIKKVLAALLANELVYFMVDHSYSKKGVEVDFFGKKVVVPKGAAIAAIKTNAPIILGVGFRTKGLKYKFIFSEIIEYSLGENEQENIREIMSKCIKVTENIICRYPNYWGLFRKFSPGEYEKKNVKEFTLEKGEDDGHKIKK